MLNFRPYTGFFQGMFDLECWGCWTATTDYLIWRIPADDLGPETFRVNKRPVDREGPLPKIEAYSHVGDAYSFAAAVELAEKDVKEQV